MTTAIKRRRGTTAQHATFAGLEGELTVDTTKDTVVVHDGATAGGFPLAKESQATTNVAITGGTITGITDLAIADGGTGASTAADARTNLGLGTAATVADNTLVHLAGTETITGVKTFSVDASISGLTVGKGGGAVGTNTIIGNSAGTSNTTAARNSYLGYFSGQVNATSSDNTGLGYAALYQNTGGANTSVGSQALTSNTTGNWQSALGYNALGSNTTGAYNTAIGAQSLNNNTTASNNTAVGYQAGYSNTTGYASTYIGFKSGYAVTTGACNTFVGYQSGLAATTAYGNTFVGVAYNTTGAGSAITTGANNTILGGYTGNQGGLDIRTASNYIVLSDGDGNPLLYGSKNGSNTEWSVSGSSSTNTGTVLFKNNAQTIYWQQATNNTNYFIADADFSHYAYLNQNPTAWNWGSDARIKTDIQELDYGLDTVMAMQPKRYKFTQSGKIDIGFIAQELRTVVPEAVSGTEVEFSDDDTPQERASKTLGVGKETLIPILVKAIQELKAEVDSLKQQLGQ